MTKAALLMKEPVRWNFSPAAVHGFDLTTSRRLRIPPEIVEGERFPKEPWRLPDESRELLRPYFSVREFDEHPSFGVVPLRANNTTTALLIFTAEELKPYIEYFAEHSKEIAEAFNNSRPQLSAQPSVVAAEQMRTAVEHEITKANTAQKTLLFLYIDVSSLMETIRNTYPNAEPYFYYLELLRLTSRYFRNNGITITAGSDTILVVLESKRAKKGNLMIHQLIQRLSGYFSPQVSFPVPAYRQLYYPGDGEAPEDFLEGYL